MRRNVTIDQSLLDLTMMRASALVRHGRTRFLVTAEQAARHEQFYESQCLSVQISMKHIILQEQFPNKQHYRHCDKHYGVPLQHISIMQVYSAYPGACQN